MVKAVIFDMYETLITHYNSPLYFGTQMAMDAGISEEAFQSLWRPMESDRTIGKITLEEYVAELTNKGMIEGTPVDNADGSKTVKMTSGAEVKLTQDGSRNILIEIPGYTEGNNDNTTPNEPTKAIITFTINGNTYQAEEGMTWAEYRTSGLNVEQGKPITEDSPPLEYISDGITVCVPAGFTVRYNGTAVVYGDKIVANGIYVSDNPKY